MPPRLEIQGTTVVLRGKFTPAVFQPRWFADNKLIRRSEVAAADIKVFHSSAVQFSVEWLDVEVTEDRLQFGTLQDAFYEALRDVTVSALELMEDIELQVMGLNRMFHFELPSDEQWNDLGYRLVPKRGWDEILDDPGMLSVYVQGRRSDNHEGYIRVKAEPSLRVRHGIYIEVNDHFDFQRNANERHRSLAVQEILRHEWDAAMKRGLAIAEKVVSLGGDQ